MPLFRFPSSDNYLQDKQDLDIKINEKTFSVKKKVCIFLSKTIAEELKKYPNKTFISFTINNKNFIGGFDEYSTYIEKLLNGEPIYIFQQNSDFLSSFAHELEIETLSSFISDLIFDENIINDFYINAKETKDFNSFYKAVSSIHDSSNIDNAVKKTISMINLYQSTEILRAILSIFERCPLINISQMLTFFLHIEEEKKGFIQEAIMFMLKEIQFFKSSKVYQISIFILHAFYKNNYIKKETLDDIFHKTKYPLLFIDVFGIENYNLSRFQIIENELKPLKEKNYELHDKACLEGHSPDYFLCLIRNDDLDRIITYNLDDLQPRIQPSIYERISLINTSKCSLIEYSAFFGSTKTFKYFTTVFPEHDYQNCMIYAFAGGSKEIVSLLYNSKANHATLEYKLPDLKIAAEFHQNAILTWHLQNYSEQIDESYIQAALNGYNFEGFCILIKNGFSFFDILIATTISANAIFLDYLLRLLYNFPKEIGKKYLNGRKIFVY